MTIAPRWVEMPLTGLGEVSRLRWRHLPRSLRTRVEIEELKLSSGVISLLPAAQECELIVRLARRHENGDAELEDQGCREAGT